MERLGARGTLRMRDGIRTGIARGSWNGVLQWMRRGTAKA
tara:strand:- start:609 stop:728 length:120 start_codon:yes stop_codon:yes gene_type:complete